MDKSKRQQNIIKFASFNCNSVKASYEDIRHLCKNVDLVALQETWLLPFDVPFLVIIDKEFECTRKSAVDISTGILRGRPYGGVAILWRTGLFQTVTVLECNCPRITAIKATSGERSIIVFSVYMPTDSIDNLPIFTECLSKICAVMDSSDVEAVYILGDFNAHPGELFCSELLNFCKEQSWDLELLGLTSNNHTYVSGAHGSTSWLDHCVVTRSAWHTVARIYVDHDVYCSDHLPLIIECKLSLVRSKVKQSTHKVNKIMWENRNGDQIDVYRAICNSKLSKLEFPQELFDCGSNHCHCEDHKDMIKNMYIDIVNILSDAAIQNSCSKCNRFQSKNTYLWLE